VKLTISIVNIELKNRNWWILNIIWFWCWKWASNVSMKRHLYELWRDKGCQLWNARFREVDKDWLRVSFTNANLAIDWSIAFSRIDQLRLISTIKFDRRWWNQPSIFPCLTYFIILQLVSLSNLHNLCLKYWIKN